MGGHVISFDLILGWSPDTYKLAIVFRFRDCDTVPRVVQTGLRPGGWLILETFAATQLNRPDTHIRNPAFTLQPGELQHPYPDFDVVFQREDILEDRMVERFLGRKR